MDELLTLWNEDLLVDEFIREIVDREYLDKGWLGNTPATNDLIDEKEERLGVKLPPSYRQFLGIANGWVYPGNDMDFPGELLPIDKVDWVRDGESVANVFNDLRDNFKVPDEQYFVYGDEQDPVCIRPEYIEYCLVISEETEGGVYLLNSKIQTEDGEWEAWHLSSKLPGAYRSRSFEELLRQQHRLLLYYRS